MRIAGIARRSHGRGRMNDVIRPRGSPRSSGPVVALRDVSIHLEEGEMLGLIGDNGAGKSTLIKILTGFHQPDAGQLYLDGEPVTLRSVNDARQRGIETVYQDLALINDLPVYLNMSLKREATLRWTAAARQAARCAARHASGSARWRSAARRSTPRWRSCPAASARRSPWLGRCSPTPR